VACRPYGVTAVLSDRQQKLQGVSTNNEASDPQLIARVSELRTMVSESHVHQGVSLQETGGGVICGWHSQTGRVWHSLVIHKLGSRVPYSLLRSATCLGCKPGPPVRSACNSLTGLMAQQDITHRHSCHVTKLMKINNYTRHLRFLRQGHSSHVCDRLVRHLQVFCQWTPSDTLTDK
jgi:hypothetical protein